MLHTFIEPKYIEHNSWTILQFRRLISEILDYICFSLLVEKVENEAKFFKTKKTFIVPHL